MAKLNLSLLILLQISIFYISGAVESTSVTLLRSRPRNYIEASCRATRYPALCIQYLSSFSNSTIQNPQQVAQAALYASLYRARSTRSYMLNVAQELKATKAKEYQLVKDCLDQINNGVLQLSQSIGELHRLVEKAEAVIGGDESVFWHISNVETWTSAALTDASNCVDEFPGRRMSKLMATIKGKVLNMAQTTSNALALFHQYAARYTARVSRP